MPRADQQKHQNVSPPHQGFAPIRAPAVAAAISVTRPRPRPPAPRDLPAILRDAPYES